jgi:hypothetical protein
MKFFENVYFGKPYKLRCGKTAIFLRKTETNYCILLIKSDFDFKRIVVNLKGRHFYHKELDVVETL